MKNFYALTTSLAFATLAGSLAPMPCTAQQATTARQYRFTTIDYPGATASVCIGINSRGQIACSAFGFSQDLPFRYDSRSALISLIPVNLSPGWNADAFGINDSGAVVGYVYPPGDSVENGFLVTNNAEYREFAVPWAAYTEARGINNSGIITGTVFFNGPGSAGFVYDPKAGSYTEILPSPYTEAVGITSAGDIVGTVYLDAGAIGPGAPAGQYGYLRAPDGSVRYFRVNGQDTYSRGISDEGAVVGYFGDLPFPQVIGFVASVDSIREGKSLSGFVALAVPAKNQIQIPGAFGTLPQGISGSGIVSGTFVDVSGTPHGFVARPRHN
jgi:hypothetical protein